MAAEYKPIIFLNIPVSSVIGPSLKCLFFPCYFILTDMAKAYHCYKKNVCFNAH